MRRSFRLRVILALLAIAPIGITAQPTAAQAPRPVLFVCEHGTVRSLLAKVLFDEFAAAIGLNMTAVSRGTRADSIVPPWMLQGLTNDRVVLGDWRPQTLQPSDLTNALYVVSFDVPAAATANASAPRAHWDNLPSVSRDYATGRDAIKVRVHQLVDSLKRANMKGKP